MDEELLKYILLNSDFEYGPFKTKYKIKDHVIKGRFDVIEFIYKEIKAFERANWSCRIIIDPKILDFNLC